MIYFRRLATCAAFLAGLTLIAFSASADTPSANPSVLIIPRETGGRLFVQPNGPFAVMLFPEDALADHIGIIYYKNMTNPVDGAWGITNRFWQLQEWGSDVTAFAWGPSGKTLYVSTSPIYGTGFLYRIDLFSRRAKRIYPPKNIKSGTDDYSDTEIVSVNAKAKKMKIKFQKSESSQSESFELPFD